MKIPFTRQADRGAALVEYAVLVSLIAVTSIFSIDRLGEKVSDTYRDIATELSDAGDPPRRPTDTPTSEPDTGPDTGPSTAPTNDAGCQQVPDDGAYYQSSDWPGASCFTHSQTNGETEFNYAAFDTQPMFVAGDPPGYMFSVYGNDADNTVVIDSLPTRLFYDGAGGTDTLELRGMTSSSVDIRELFGAIVIDNAPGTLHVDINDCAVDRVVFDDTTMTRAEYEAAGGFDCNDLGGGGFGPGPGPGPGGGGGDYKYALLDNCITSPDYSTYHWCKGSGGGAGLPSDLEWRAIPAGYEYGNTTACAYDPAPEWDGYVTNGGVTQSPDPSFDDLACY